MNPFVERVRSASNIEVLARELTKLTTEGERLKGLCPFHDEDSASFIIYPEQGRWYCYGCHRAGSVFDLIMDAHNISFWDSVLMLASRTGIPLPDMTEEEKAEIVLIQQIEDLLSKYASACHKELVKYPDVLDYLYGRGITDESLEEYRIGVGIPLPVKVEKDLAKHAGLTDSRLIGRIIFPVMKHGKVVQVSARAIGKEKPKYLNLSRPLYPWNAHVLRDKQVVLVEGVVDAILLAQAGFPAVSTLSSNFKKEWFSLIGKNTDCRICYDSDSAGENANRKIAEQLFDKGHNVYVLELPQPHDPASYIQKEGAGAFEAILRTAKPFPNFLIDSIPPDLNSYDLDRELQLIFSKLIRFDPTSHDRYITKIAERFSLGKVAVRKGLADYLRNAKKQGIDEGEVDSWNIRRRTTNPSFFNPGQDFINETLYYVIYLEIENEGVFKPFVITSTKDWFIYTKQELLKRDLLCRTSALPGNYSRWSIGTDYENNVLDYLEGKTHIEPRDLYQEIRNYFIRFVCLPDKLYYDFLVLWCMATYHYRLYDSFGYIFLNAMKRSGKTQTLTLISQIAFNACQADAITEAVLKRRVNVDAATILADEAEFFKAKLKDEKSMVFEVFNGGYKRSGKASMVDPDTKQVEDFCTYSPKALANTTGLYDILADRCIRLDLLRAGIDIPQFIEAEHAANFQHLRDKLYCFTLEYITNIVESKHTLKHPKELQGRDWEMWYSILTLATFLDNYHVVDSEQFETENGLKIIDTLYDRMVTMAVERREYKQKQEEQEQKEPIILRAIWDYVMANPTEDNWYPITEVAGCVKDALGWDKYSVQRLYHFVFETTKIAKRIGNNIDFRQYHPTDADGKRKQITQIRLIKDRIQTKAKQLFEMVLGDVFDND